MAGLLAYSACTSVESLGRVSQASGFHGHLCLNSSAPAALVPPACQVGVLTRSLLDDGRGFARAKVFKHGHESDTGAQAGGWEVGPLVVQRAWLDAVMPAPPARAVGGKVGGWLARKPAAAQ